MTTYVIDPPALTAVPVAGGGMFPVRRVFPFSALGATTP